MYLLTAILSYVCAGLFLYIGIGESSWWRLLLAAVWMAAGNYNVRRYKQNH